jgi:uncharacterized protein (TIGR02996 family)
MSHPVHPTEQALLQSIVEHPGEDDRWLVLADWLDDHEDPPLRAELLRLHRRLITTCCEPEKHPERWAWQVRIVELLASGVEPCVPRETVLLGQRGKVQMTFVWVPPGSFLMGSPADEKERAENETPHRVSLTHGFWLGVHPVTQVQWRRVMGRNPSYFKGDELPVEQVSWDDGQGFCEKLKEKTGRQFRLPSEAEWEYACRAGTTTPFWFGETISTDQANYHGNYTYGKGKKGVYRKQTTLVGSFPPNAWGLTDLHGNIWEWCQDWYSPLLDEDIEDLQGGDSGDARVLRGGCWGGYPRWCRAAYRRGVEPAYRGRNFGCRVVLCLD